MTRGSQEWLIVAAMRQATSELPEDQQKAVHERAEEIRRLARDGEIGYVALGLVGAEISLEESEKGGAG